MTPIIFWIIAALTFLGGETVTTSWVIRTAYVQDNHNLIYLSMLFLASSTFGVIFFSNNHIRNKIKTNSIYLCIRRKKIIQRLIDYLLKIVNKVNSFTTLKEKQSVLILLSTCCFPAWLNAFMSPYFQLNTKQIFFPILIGAIIWYLCLVLTIVGVGNTSDIKIAILAIIIIQLVFMLLRKLIIQKINKK